MSRSHPAALSSFDPQDLVTSTAVAAFASDQSGRITVWNQAAEELLGHEATRVIGRRCFNVICGRDLFGNRFCSECCAVRKMRRHREPIHPFRFQVKHRSGEMLGVKCSIIVAPGGPARRLNFLHLLEPLSPASESVREERVRPGTATTAPSPAPGDRESVSANPVCRLTPREIEVLRLVASGVSNQEIARSLQIQVSTARNHIQHILEKLGAHSRLQAVYIAQRCELL